MLKQSATVCLLCFQARLQLKSVDLRRVIIYAPHTSGVLGCMVFPLALSASL